MRAFTLRLLGVMMVLLLLALAWQWLGPDGRLRPVQWQAPDPHQPDYAGMLERIPGSGSTDITRFVATLERPLFSPSRRPPPPPPPPTVAPPPPPPDPLASVHLFGVFMGEDDQGGIIARVDGKPRRIYTGQNIGAWTLKRIEDRKVTMVRGAETRVLNLVHARAPEPAAVAAAPAPGAAPPAAGAGPAPATPRPDVSEMVRRRTELRNAARAKAGLPPLP